MALPEIIDRLVASPKFRRFSAGFLPFRPIARHRSKVLFDLMAGFVHSQILLACVRLDLPNLLLERPRSLSELARDTGLTEEAMTRLLKAAAPLGRDDAGMFMAWGLSGKMLQTMPPRLR